MTDSMTIQLMQIIGSPFAKPVTSFNFSEQYLNQLFELAFENRVELLFLNNLNKAGKIAGFEERYEHLQQRAVKTLGVIARLWTSFLLRNSLCGIQVNKTLSSNTQ